MSECPACLEQVSADPARTSALLRLVACSEFAAAVLLKSCDWFSLFVQGEVDDAAQELRTGFASRSLEAGDDVTAKRTFRNFRNRQLTGILWREFFSGASTGKSLADLSSLADGIVDASVRYASETLGKRFGVLPHDDGEPAPLIVLAMGKLGGTELNFSSDIDLIFVYPHDGETTGPKSISAQEYFTRIARKTVALLEEVTEDGFVYRVDTRLRPFGDSGPPVLSTSALEAYLIQHGRSWERYAYVKARVIGPASGTALSDELMQDLINPFVYRRYLDYGVFESLREMKSLIASEVQKRELADNVKLGPGGIREIEFIVQSLQLVRGGANIRLRRSNLLAALPLLVGERGLAAGTADELAESYLFLRRFENSLQAIRDQQTHDLPETPADEARLALAMGYAGAPELSHDMQKYRNLVRQRFSEIAFKTGGDAEETGLAGELGTLWSRPASADDWFVLLDRHGFADAAEVAAEISRFAATRALQQLETTARRRLNTFVPRLLRLLRDRRRPSVVLGRMLKIVQQIVRRSAYIALLNENPAVLGRVAGLCESSAYLAGEIARFPLLLDELLDPRIFSTDITAADMRADLEQRLSLIEEHDSERSIEALAHFQRATLFRIAVADFSGSLPIMIVSDRLTDLAELVLRRALELAWHDLTAKHGEPWILTDNGRRGAGFGVIAYGKFGGMELSYRSDLDLVFLHDAGAAGAETDGEKPLEHSMFFARLARRLVHFLTTQTTSGELYEVDTRLRPSGESGLLVISVEAFEKYQDQNAWTWEHQALLRARPVAGSGVVAREFERVRTETLRNRVRRRALRDDVLDMRGKMRKQLDKGDDRQFDLKQGAGGIADIEFLVQYLVLRNGPRNAAVIHYTDNIRQLGTLCAAGYLAQSDATHLQQIYKAYRFCLHRLALDGKPPLVDGDEFADEREFVVNIWQQVFGE